MNENCSECIYMDSGMCKLKPAACLNYDHFQRLPMIQISVSDFEKKYISRLAFDEIKEENKKLLEILELILDQVEYIREYKNFTETSTAIIPNEVLEIVAERLKKGNIK